MPTRVRRPLLLALATALVLPGCASPSGSAAPSQEATSAPSTSTAAPGPTRSDAEIRVDEVLAELDRRAQVAQLFVVGVPLDDLGRGETLVRAGVAGVFLAGRSQAPAEELAATTDHWQSLAPGPRLWTAADQEGGAVQTLQGPGFTELPAAAAQGDLPPAELAALAAGLGSELHDAGINLNLAPVADVVPAGTEAGNGPIGYYDRQYGSTADEVVDAAGTVLEGLAAADVTATLKHFPGLGRVRDNTDFSAAVTDSVTTADDEQVQAFATLARSPADPFVMTSSATYTQLDPEAPAAFSPVVVDQLLRDRLGFDGVVISDDLGSARAVQDVPVGDRAVRFLAAGGTLVLTVDPDTLPAMVDAVLARSEADPAFSSTVDEAVRTALLAKAEAGLLG